MNTINLLSHYIHSMFTYTFNLFFTKTFSIIDAFLTVYQ